MIDIFLIYYISRYYSLLARRYGRNKWLYAIIGVLTYYIAGISVITLLNDYRYGTGAPMPSLFGMFVIIPIGLFACVLLFVILEQVWRSKASKSNSNILDDYK